ncbi:type I-E CRISPR-associated protein Cas6/Cse3/CasE [Streptodolium elevatio]
MFLTRFRINTARVGARRLLSSPHRLHGAVAASFADPADDPVAGSLADALADRVAVEPRESSGDGGPRVLWRLDENALGNVFLYIVSPARPDLTHLVEQVGWPTTGGWDTYEYAPFLEKLTTGDTWDFRLTANPVHSVRNRDGVPTKRTAHLTARHQMNWLVGKQQSAGFEVVEKPVDRQRLPEGDELQLVVHNERKWSFGKGGGPARGGGGGPVTLTTVTYDGRLRITDADAMRHTLTAGLGKAKAYGCGLMTLAPAR